MPGKLDEQIHRQQQRLAAIEQGWKQPLVGRPARTPASAAWRARIAAGDVGGNAGAACAPGRTPGTAVSERLDRLLEAIGLALSVFEDPATSETWLKAPHPLLHQVSPLQHYRTAIGAAQMRLLPAGDGAGCFGGRWLREADQLALVLPSVVVL